MLKNFNMKDYKPSKIPFLLGVKLEGAHSNPFVNNTLYKKLASCLIYLTHTQPGMSYAVSVESIHMG